jgi:hypothetical protein
MFFIFLSYEFNVLSLCVKLSNYAVNSFQRQSTILFEFLENSVRKE